MDDAAELELLARGVHPDTDATVRRLVEEKGWDARALADHLRRSHAWVTYCIRRARGKRD